MKFIESQEEGSEMSMSSKTKRNGNTGPQATSTLGKTGEVSVQGLFDKQKEYFATDVTKTYEWRIDQLNCLSRMLKENDRHFSEASRRDFKTALQENIFEVTASLATIEFTKSQLKEWMKPVEAPIPRLDSVRRPQ